MNEANRGTIDSKSKASIYIGYSRLNLTLFFNIIQVIISECYEVLCSYHLTGIILSLKENNKRHACDIYKHKIYTYIRPYRPTSIHIYMHATTI